MRLEKEFTVSAPVERAWSEMLDLEDLVSCLPAARMSRLDGEPIYGGDIRIDAAGTILECRGTVRPLDVDEDEHVATIQLHGRELAGPALGSGTVESRVATVNGSTRVMLSAELKLTGQRAGSEAVEQAAGKILDEFARRLEKRILEREDEAPTPREPAAAAAPAAERRAPVTALGDGRPGGSVEEALRGAALPSAAALLVLILLVLLGRPRKRATLVVSYRW
jgi:carbon monoxide dehydrogenase subunit G